MLALFCDEWLLSVSGPCCPRAIPPACSILLGGQSGPRGHFSQREQHELKYEVVKERGISGNAMSLLEHKEGGRDGRRAQAS